MNRDQVKGAFGELQGRAKMAVGNLTDDPDIHVEGAAQTLLGRMQRRFGDSKEELRRAWNRLRGF